MNPQTPIWSATPTPLTADLQLDLPSVARLVEWHLSLGVEGIMLLGTCGEGPWLPESQRAPLIAEAVAASAGRLKITVQTTDNSAPRVLAQIEEAARLGADLVTVAQPYFLLNATPKNLLAFYYEIFEHSPLPVAFYDRGKNASVPVPDDLLPEIYAHPRVAIAKDSSGTPARRALALEARAKRPDLTLLNGDEFQCTDYFKAGYDGVLLGGAILNARYARAIAQALQNGDEPAARAIDETMQALLFGVYGGRNITCWLTGLKETLVRLGVFSTNANHLRYPLTPECSQEIDRLLASEREWLSPCP